MARFRLAVSCLRELCDAAFREWKDADIHLGQTRTPLRISNAASFCPGRAILHSVGVRFFSISNRTPPSERIAKLVGRSCSELYRAISRSLGGKRRGYEKAAPKGGGEVIHLWAESWPKRPRVSRAGNSPTSCRRRETYHPPKRRRRHRTEWQARGPTGSEA